MSPARWRGVVALIVIALVCAIALGLTRELTASRIAAARAAAAAEALLAMTGRTALPTGDWSRDTWHLCDGTVLKRGRAEGYAGPIDWLLFIGLYPEPRVRALRVVAHQETPGIADFLNDPGHAWMSAVVDLRTGAPPPDTLSGATVTTRALGQSIATALAHTELPTAGDCP